MKKVVEIFGPNGKAIRSGQENNSETSDARLSGKSLMLAILGSGGLFSLLTVAVTAFVEQPVREVHDFSIRHDKFLAGIESVDTKDKSELVQAIKRGQEIQKYGKHYSNSKLVSHILSDLEITLTSLQSKLEIVEWSNDAEGFLKVKDVSAERGEAIANSFPTDASQALLVKIRERLRLVQTSDASATVREKGSLSNSNSDSLTLPKIALNSERTNVLSTAFLESGLQAQKAVARLVVTREHRGLPAGSAWATGFLISPNLLVTAGHAIPTSEMAENISAIFDFQDTPSGEPQTPTTRALDPNRFFYSSSNLGFSVVAIESGNPNRPWITHVKNLEWKDDMRFNLVHHILGKPKTIQLGCPIYKLYGNYVTYKADTGPGSSGSPVMDDQWRVLAVHHGTGERDENGLVVSREGVRFDRILQDLKSSLEKLDGESRDFIRTQLFDRGN